MIVSISDTALSDGSLAVLQLKFGWFFAILDHRGNYWKNCNFEKSKIAKKYPNFNCNTAKEPSEHTIKENKSTILLRFQRI